MVPRLFYEKHNLRNRDYTLTPIIMKINVFKVRNLIAVMAISLSLAACGDGESEEPDDISGGDVNNEQNDEISKKVSQNVFVSVTYNNYSWDISLSSYLEYEFPDKSIRYGILCGYNGEPYYYSKYFTMNGISVSSTEPLFIDGTGSPYGMQYMYWRSLIALQEKTSLTTSEKELKSEILSDFSKTESKAKSSYWGQIFAEIDGVKYTAKEFGNKRKESSASTNVPSGGSGSSSGSSSATSYEKPDVGFYDFSATRSSLKVQYRIYNKDEANVTSAKIYYGTSSNPTTSKSASVSGSMISANISGLKAGTTYYVKCVATGKGGTTTTSVTKCITNY